jgi:hypothetical protein
MRFPSAIGHYFVIIMVAIGFSMTVLFFTICSPLLVFLGSLLYISTWVFIVYFFRASQLEAQKRALTSMQRKSITKYYREPE